jgi:hypothetical protein
MGRCILDRWEGAMRRIWDFSGVGEIDYALMTRMPLVQIDVVYGIVLVIRRGIYDSIMFELYEETDGKRKGRGIVE